MLSCVATKIKDQEVGLGTRQQTREASESVDQWNPPNSTSRRHGDMSTGKELVQGPAVGQGHAPSSAQGWDGASCGATSMADSDPQVKAMPEARDT